jgi:hypothetical protein
MDAAVAKRFFEEAFWFALNRERFISRLVGARVP